MVDDKQDYDLYDVLAELGWGMNPRTRHDRTMAFTYKHEDWINGSARQSRRHGARNREPVRTRRHRRAGEPADLPDAGSQISWRIGRAANGWKPARHSSVKPRRGCLRHDADQAATKYATDGKTELPARLAMGHLGAVCRYQRADIVEPHARRGRTLMCRAWNTIDAELGVIDGS